MPVLGASGAVCQTAQKTVVTPQDQFLDRLLRLLDEARGDSTVAVLGQGCGHACSSGGPDVQKTVNSSELQFLDGVDVPVVVQRQVACPAVDADSWRCL